MKLSVPPYLQMGRSQILICKWPQAFPMVSFYAVHFLLHPPAAVFPTLTQLWSLGVLPRVLYGNYNCEIK